MVSIVSCLGEGLIVTSINMRLFCFMVYRKELTTERNKFVFINYLLYSLSKPYCK